MSNHNTHAGKKAPNRVIDLVGQVNDEMLANFSIQMREIIDYDMEIYEFNKMVKNEYKQEYETIRINLSTPGGSVTAGIGIMGVMDEAIAPIHIHVTGQCMSMGISILAHADTRSACKFSSFMIHGMSTGTWGYLDEGRDSLDYFKNLEKELNEEIASKTKYTVEELNSYANVAHFFGYKEALEKGLLTKDIYDPTSEPRFSKKQLLQVIASDVDKGLTSGEILDAFIKDELYDCEMEMVLEILEELEEYENEQAEEDDEVEEVVEDIAKEGNEDVNIEVVDAEPVDSEEDINVEDILPVEEVEDGLDGIEFQMFLDDLAYNDYPEDLFTGDLSPEEITKWLMENLEDFEVYDFEYLLTCVEFLLGVEDDE